MSSRFQVKRPLGGGVNGVLRLDYQDRRTWWGPYNLTLTRSVNLIDPARRLRGPTVVG